MLFICTVPFRLTLGLLQVIFDVYALVNGEGRLDAVDALQAGPRRGELIIKRRYYRHSDKSLCAELLDQATGNALLAPLEWVRVLVIDPKGMLIEGTQTVYRTKSAKSASERRTQRWLAKLPGQPAILDTEKLLKRSARRLALIAASSFDPADDDRIF